MDFLIITGLSGAGKSRAADVMEDLDYYCVDNMPVALMPRFAELCIATGGRYENVALVTDVREKNGFGELLKKIDQLKEMNCSVRILYMDADVRTIVRRYKESRRPHPLATRGTSIEDAVHKEMDLLAPIRERADFIVNSSNLTLGMLQNKLFSLFAPNGEKREIDVTVMSFGYKHGLPMLFAPALPAPIASITVAAPVTASPPENTPSRAVTPPSSASMPPLRVKVRPSVVLRIRGFGLVPMAMTTVSTSRIQLLPGTGTGLRRPFSSGSPSSCF